MDCLELHFDTLDWVLIRQTLSLALLRNREVSIAGGAAFIDENNEYLPLFFDIKKILGDLTGGELLKESTSIIIKPGTLKYGRFLLETGKYSSLVDIFLFLLPSLLYRDFRSVLSLRGVSHSPVSYPTSFVKETLLTFLEKTGHFASLNLERFGFYGTGGGRVESRIYPAEPESCDTAFFDAVPEKREIIGAKVFVSGLSSGAAKRQKEFLLNELELPENKIAIIEIIDSDGYGNSVQVFGECRYTQGESPVPVIFFREMEIYNYAGDFINDEENTMEALRDLVDESKGFINNSQLPGAIERELMPYLTLSGHRSEAKDAVLRATRKLCESLLII
ncbi:MAG: hypothetical protein GY754_40575 [bacterium]|nr:hypothetical protein [bacterium]